MSIAADIQKLDPGSLIDLFELDATEIGGSLFYWTNEVNELGNNVVWNSNTYFKMPIEADGFEKSGDGKQARPTIRAANVTGLVGALARELEDLIGAKVTRHRTFVKYLDAVNFVAGNPLADPNAAFDPEVWFVERKVSENGIFIEFELASALDMQGVFLPRRQVIRNVCTWQYRSAECGYSGGAKATENDVPTTNINLDRCGKRITSCELRFGLNAPLPFGGFPGVGRS